MNPKIFLNKRSQSHVEVIISFSLFVGAIILLFVFINPLERRQEEQPKIDFVKLALTDAISDRVGILSVITSVDDGCFSLDEVTSDYGTRYFIKQDFSNKKKYDVYFSENLPGSPPAIPGCSSGNYTLGVYRQEKIIFYNKIKDMVDRYNADRGLLQNELKIGSDFWFSFKYLNNTMINGLSVNEVSIPIGLGRESKDYPLKIMGPQGEEIEARLNLRVW